MINEQQYPTKLSVSTPARGMGREAVSVQPVEPPIHGKADELRKFVGELEHRMGRIDAYLFGEPAEGRNNDSRPEPDGLAFKVSDACTRVGMLCGHASTIQQKLSGEA